MVASRENIDSRVKCTAGACRLAKGGKLRIGHGFYERDPQKSFWNYLWKTSFAGVTDIVM